MRKYLLPESGNFYKVNMHNHTTNSDGEHTPEQIKEIYKSLGYSANAYARFLRHYRTKTQPFRAAVCHAR